MLDIPKEILEKLKEQDIKAYEEITKEGTLKGFPLYTILENKDGRLLIWVYK